MSGETIGQDFMEIVDGLTSVVMAGDSRVDELAIPGVSESLRCNRGNDG